jgi:hypothetical protein
VRDDDDANFVHDPNVHIERVQSITDKAMLARQWKERIEALVHHHSLVAVFEFWKEIHVECGSRESKNV